MENYRQLYESMFSKNLADEDARDFLLDITEKYPFFSPAQFLLLHKTAKTDADYKQQLMRTAAAFNNNYWLNYLLLQQDKEAFIESFSAQETIADSPLVINQKQLEAEQQPIDEAIALNEHDTIVSELDTSNIELQDVEHHAEEITQVIEETPLITEKFEPEGGESNKELNEDVSKENSAIESNDIIPAEDAKKVYNENEPVLINVDEPVMSPAFDDIQASFETKNELDNESFSREAINSAFINGEEENKGENKVSEEPIFTDDPVEETPANSDEQEEENTKEEFTAPLKTDLAEAAAILDTNPTENGPVFEPLHTTDYFASVGIKLSDELKPGDRLGNQLKSFTEWLKTMKKLPGHIQPAVLPETTEKQNSNIQQLADNSNKEDEIITEAMADVLMQQGRIDKAVEVLKKLSLLNPSKNTYFAAKIDKLKEE